MNLLATTNLALNSTLLASTAATSFMDRALNAPDVMAMPEPHVSSYCSVDNGDAQQEAERRRAPSNALEASLVRNNLILPEHIGSIHVSDLTLRRLGVKYFGELTSYTPQQIKRAYKIGPKRIRELNVLLQVHGLGWDSTPLDWRSPVARALQPHFDDPSNHRQLRERLDQPVHDLGFCTFSQKLVSHYPFVGDIVRLSFRSLLNDIGPDIQYALKEVRGLYLDVGLQIDWWERPKPSPTREEHSSSLTDISASNGVEVMKAGAEQVIREQCGPLVFIVLLNVIREVAEIDLPEISGLDTLYRLSPDHEEQSIRHTSLDDFYDYSGIDSMMIIEIRAEIERLYRISIPEADLFGGGTIGEYVDMILGHIDGDDIADALRDIEGSQRVQNR